MNGLNAINAAVVIGGVLAGAVMGVVAEKAKLERQVGGMPEETQPREITYVPGSTKPMKPLPELLARLGTTQGSFRRPECLRYRNEESFTEPATECTYLATEYCTVDGDILRLLHAVQPPGGVNQKVVAAMFEADDAPEYVLEHLPDGADFIVARYHPSPDMAPDFWFDNPEWANLLSQFVYVSDPHGFCCRSAEDWANDEWFYRNERVLDIEHLPQGVEHA